MTRSIPIFHSKHYIRYTTYEIRNTKLALFFQIDYKPRRARRSQRIRKFCLFNFFLINLNMSSKFIFTIYHILHTKYEYVMYYTKLSLKNQAYFKKISITRRPLFSHREHRENRENNSYR